MDGTGNNNTGFKAIKRTLTEIFESEEDFQVKDVIASQLLAIDESLFMSYLGSKESYIRLLVLRHIENQPELLKKVRDVSFIEAYYLEEQESIIRQYLSIFEQIDNHYFTESEIERWREMIRLNLQEKKPVKLDKLARMSGLLGIVEGLELFGRTAEQEYLQPPLLIDFLWMAKRLLTRSNLRNNEQLEFSRSLKQEQLVSLADFSDYGITGTSLLFELLVILGDIDQRKNTAYGFFDEIMQGDDYQLQIILLKALKHSQNYSADIILCNGLAKGDYDSVREAAAEVLAQRTKIACLEVVRNSLIHDPDFNVRKSCVQILAAKGERADYGLLIRAVLDSDKQVMQEALAALQDRQIDRQTAIMTEKLLDNMDIKARQAALLVLQRVNMNNKETLLAKALKNEKTFLKAEIIKTIGLVGQFTEEIAQLLESCMINDPFFEIRAEAALCLGRIRSIGSVPLLLDRLFEEEDFEAKKGIMIALVALGSREVLQKISDILKNPANHTNSDLLLAVEAAGLMKSDEALEYLQPHLSGDDYDIRWQSVVSIGEIMDEVVDASLIPEGLIDSIIKLVQEDPRPTIRSAACWTLGRTTHARIERVVQVLVDRLKNDEDNHVKEMSAEMLGFYQSPLNEAIPVLIDMLKNERDPSVRYYSARSLGLIARSISGEIMTYEGILEKSEHG